MTDMVNMTEHSPLVSVIVPTFREERYIGTCLDSLVAQDYPADRMEILVIDGQSDDRTPEIVQEIADKATHVRLLANPRRITPCALNIGIRAATGTIIVRIDAHCEYPKDYVSRCVQTLAQTGADNVGGVLITLPGDETTTAHAIVYAQTSRFGLGGARYRLGKGKAGPADTVPFGCFRRDIFDRIGMFDEALLRNQDNELNARIIANGGLVYCDPSIQIKYYSRPKLGGFLRMLRKNGLYHWLVLKTNPKAFRFRHMAPGFFVLVLLLSGIGGLIWRPLWLVGAAAMGIYALAAFASAAGVAARHGLKYFFVMPGVFLACHLHYGVATWAGFFRFFLFGSKGSVGQGQQAGRT